MSVIGKLKVMLGLDSSELEQGAKNAEGSVRKMADTVQRKVDKVDFSKIEAGITKAAHETSSASEIIKTAAAEGIDALKESISGSEAEIQRLEQQYKDLSATVSKAAPGLVKYNLQKELGSIKTALDEEKGALQEAKQALSELTAEQDKYSKKTESFRSRIMEIRNSMMELREQGRQNTQAYKDLVNELGRLGTIQREVNKEFLAATTGATQWGGIISGVQGVAGAFAAAQGAIGLFNTKNEALIAIQTRLQSVMAVLVGLQQVSNTLHATSEFRITTVTKVTELLSRANKWLATTFHLSAAGATALMAAITLGLSLAITGLVYLINHLITKNREAREEFERFTKAVSAAATEPLSKFKLLQAQWNALGDDLEAKKKFIDDNSEAFRSLGVAVDDVSDAENLFNQGAGAFQRSILARAAAAATMEVAQEKYKAAIDKMIEADAKLKAAQAMSGPETEVRRWQTITPYGTVVSGNVEQKTQKGRLVDEANAELTNSISEINKLGDDLVSALTTVQNNVNESLKGLSDAGIKTATDIVEGSVAYYDKLISEQQQKLKEATDPKAYKAIESNIRQLESLREQITGKKERRTTKVTDNSLAAQEKATQASIAALKKEQAEYGTTIVFMEKMLSLRRQEEKFAKSDEEYRRRKAVNDELEKQISLMKRVYKVGSEQDLEARIRELKEKISTLDPITDAFEIAEALRQIDELKEKIDSLPQNKHISIKVLFETAIEDFEKELDDLSKEISDSMKKSPFLKGFNALTDRNEKISELTSRIAGYKTALIGANDEERKYINTLIEKDQAQIDSLRGLDDLTAKTEEISSAIRSGLNQAVSGLFQSLGEAMAGADLSENLKEKVLMPFAELAVQVGEMLIGFGTAGIALQKLTIEPWAALAAGAALVALGSAAKSAIQNAINTNTGGNSESYNTYTGGVRGGYSNDGAYKYATTNIGSAGSNITVDVSGSLKGEDIALAVKKVNYNKSR